MKMAMKDGQILIREADNVQFTIIKSWGKMKWSRQTQTLSGPADIELLNRLAGLVNLPPSIEAERKKLNEVMAAVDRERMNPKPEPLIPPPVKVSPFTHQVRGYNMALMTFGLVLIDSLKRLYAAGRLTKEQIAVRVEKGTIDEAEYEEITGEKYKAETKAK